MRKHRRLFIRLFIFYAVASAIFVGLSSQDAYSQLSGLLDETSDGLFSGGWGSVGQAGLLLLSTVSGGFSPQLTDVQQVFSAMLVLLTWLTTVWLLRAIIGGKSPRLRDGLYNAGSPIVASGVVLFILLLQLIPATLAVIIFSSAMATELFESGFIAMLISIVAGLMILLSVYWVIATTIALVIVTLPGMYPWQAIRTAGDMVIGRRLRILLRLVWMSIAGLIVWVLVVLPVILIVRAVSDSLPVLDSLPVIPIVITAASSIIAIWSASYTYLLYRKIVEDDAKPA